jgi:hypothetical protein
MVTNFMPLAGDPANQIGMLFGVPANDEKRSDNAISCQRVQQHWRVNRVRPIIKRQRHAGTFTGRTARSAHQ